MSQIRPQPVYEDALYALSEDMSVLVLTPNGPTIMLTADAAERSAERLLRAAAAARLGQAPGGSGLLLRH
ncbi:hypothetical protein [Phenylobacterium sp.]|uniref:hypothetical protein n=1 Tax=Phenylobacterium sp. TaxID=1871053 RepID=UPI002B653676|nr:hypothetical protein [Phenylobacterium sp.]HVI30584.1 hypothetical protein [Phenylobacterium sp.]